MKYAEIHDPIVKYCIDQYIKYISSDPNPRFLELFKTSLNIPYWDYDVEVLDVKDNHSYYTIEIETPDGQYILFALVNIDPTSRVVIRNGERIGRRPVETIDQVISITQLHDTRYTTFYLLDGDREYSLYNWYTQTWQVFDK